MKEEIGIRGGHAASVSAVIQVAAAYVPATDSASKDKSLRTVLRLSLYKKNTPLEGV